jgi:hypothetical protein
MKSKQTIIYVVLASISVGLIAVTYSHTLPIVFRNLLSQSVEVRSIVSVVLLVPLGFVMGMPFPLGMREVKENHEKGVSWMWGVNGVMSVVGSIVATVVAIMMGLRTALFFAVLVYTLAFFTALWYKMVKQ